MAKSRKPVKLSVHLNKRIEEARRQFLDVLHTSCDSVEQGAFEGFAIVAWNNTEDPIVGYYLPKNIPTMQLPSFVHDIILADNIREAAEEESDSDEI